MASLAHSARDDVVDEGSVGNLDALAAVSMPGHRVKVYRLNGQGTWDDLGTGNVSLYSGVDDSGKEILPVCVRSSEGEEEKDKEKDKGKEKEKDGCDPQPGASADGQGDEDDEGDEGDEDDERNDRGEGAQQREGRERREQALKVVVHSEADPSKQLLFHRIEQGVTYNRQGDDTIITWNDLYHKTDIALSFQEPSGCHDVWSTIELAVQAVDRLRQSTTGWRHGRGHGRGRGFGFDEEDDHHDPARVLGSLTTGQPLLNTNLVLRGGGGTSAEDRDRGRGRDRHPNGVNEYHAQYGVNSMNNSMNNSNDNSNDNDNEEDMGRGFFANVGYDSLNPHTHTNMHRASPSPVSLPDTPSLENLSAIATVVTECTLFQREGIAQQLLVPGYLKAILDVFEMAEDLEDGDGVKAGHVLIKGAIMLNDVNLLELLFSDECIVPVVGALEYGDGMELGAARGRYRNFVQGDMNLKEVVPITDAISRAKIIQAHRILYVRDTILPKTLDDSTFSTLSSMYLFNIVEVLLVLHQDATFFKDLFDRIHEAERGTEDWRDLISFLQELITLSRHIQMNQRNEILVHLSGLGLFKVMSDSLQTNDTDAKLRAIDAILATVLHDPVLLRSHIQNKEEGHVIFEQLIAVLLHPSPTGLQEQALDVIKILLDPDTMESAEMKDVFCGMFYDNHVASLIEALAAGTPSAIQRQRERAEGATVGVASTASPSTPPPTVSSLLLIVDLLSYCISQHSYRIKYCILRSNAVEKVLELMERPEKALVGAALRLLKTCLQMKDEFYVRYLMQKNIIDRMLDAYLKFCRKENLIHSALLDLLDLLRRENIRSLLSACVSSPLWEQVEMVECDKEITRAVRLKHDANMSHESKPDLTADPPSGFVAHSLGCPAVGDRDQPHIKHARRVSGVALDGMVNVDVDLGGIGTGGLGGIAGLRSLDPETRAIAAAEARRVKGEFEADEDEENYFSKLEEDDGDGDGRDGDDDPPNASRRIVLRDQDDHQGGVHHDDGPMPLQRLVDYESDDDDDTIPLSAGAKRKSGLKIQLNLGGVKVQKLDGTETTDNDGGKKKEEEPDDDRQP